MGGEIPGTPVITGQSAEIQNNWNLPQWKHHRWEEILEVTVGVAPCRSCFDRKDGDHDTVVWIGSDTHS